MAKMKLFTVRRVVVAGLVAGASALTGACALPVPAFTSPFYGQSSNSSPGSALQTATVSFCSPAGGPVHIEIDIPGATVLTELGVSFNAQNVHFDDGPEPTYKVIRPAPPHSEFTSIDSLDPGECETVWITSNEFNDISPNSGHPFTFSVSW
ncbi:hypothetical protein BH10ACT3_BH10ACT3_18460 [soil metagenome]